MIKPWIGCDLDGTLAHYDKWTGNELVIGKPIEPMVERIKKLLAKGKTVKILTARAENPLEHPDIVNAIQDWCEKHLGKRLEVTNKKDYGMVYMYDDRCVQVERNTGKIIGEDWED